MRDERRNYLVVGVFVLVVFVGLLVWLARLSGGVGASDTYSVIYDSVQGLAPGTRVLYEGFPIGIVDVIEPHPVSGVRRFRVNLAVESGWSIPEDSEAVITSPGFLSQPVIDIRGGSSPTSVAPGGEIRAGTAADLVAAVSSAASGVTDLMSERVEPLLENLAETTPEIVENLRAFSSKLNQSGDQLGSLLGPENVGRVNRILGSLETATGDLSGFGAELRVTLRQLDRLLTQANALLEEDRGALDLAIADLHESLDAFAGRSDAIAHDLEITSRNLAEFSDRLRANPSVLLRGRSESDPEEPN